MPRMSAPKRAERLPGTQPGPDRRRSGSACSCCCAGRRVPARRPAADRRRHRLRGRVPRRQRAGPGNEVRVAGVKVGKVTGVGLARDGRTPYVRVGLPHLRATCRWARRPRRTSASRPCWARSTSRWRRPGREAAARARDPGRAHGVPVRRAASRSTGWPAEVGKIDTDQLARRSRRCRRRSPTPRPTSAPSLDGPGQGVAGDGGARRGAADPARHARPCPQWSPSATTS